jgi:NAD(P)-dependent dehydrogenase (short-subunit alcohol dehydrogenase family)
MPATPISRPTMDLTDKVAIITGASRGIGEAIAKCYAKHGAKVVLASRKIEGLTALAKTIEAGGGVAYPIACHTGKEDDIKRLVAGAVAKYGKVDILVNNAATNPYFGPMLEAEWSAWDKTFEVNLKGYFMATREVVRHLKQRSAGGSIVNVASIVGMTAAVAQGIYGMTKAAVISMTMTLAVELADTAIRVNAICPGLIETHFSGALVANDEIRQRITNSSPVRRIGHPDDIAGVALLFASDASNLITGQTIVVDGGQTIINGLS